MADDYESVLCVKNEVLIYKIPPRTSNRGYRAADWKLDQPDWTGRLRVCAKSKECYLKIEDKTSGDLFAKCPVDNYPGLAVEGVLDSSRYFVLKIQDESGRHAFIGMGFQDRGDAFDFNVALQDHFKWIKQSERLAAETSQPELVPKLDLGFKEGQTITINLGNKKPGASKPRPAGGGTGILPPPPGGMAPRLAPPPGGAGVSPLAARRAPAAQQQAPSQMPLFSDFAPPPTIPAQQPPKPGDEWGDFTSASGSSDSSWVQF